MKSASASFRGPSGVSRTVENEVDVIGSHGTASTMIYDRLVLATGSRLFTPAIPGLARAQLQRRPDV